MNVSNKRVELHARYSAALALGWQHRVPGAPLLACRSFPSGMASVFRYKSVYLALHFITVGLARQPRRFMLRGQEKLTLSGCSSTWYTASSSSHTSARRCCTRGQLGHWSPIFTARHSLPDSLGERHGRLRQGPFMVSTLFFSCVSAGLKLYLQFLQSIRDRPNYLRGCRHS